MGRKREGGRGGNGEGGEGREEVGEGKEGRKREGGREGRRVMGREVREERRGKGGSREGERGEEEGERVRLGSQYVASPCRAMPKQCTIGSKRILLFHTLAIVKLSWMVGLSFLQLTFFQKMQNR